MQEIRPRWEWRTFGSSFGRAESAFADMESTGVQESDELYLLSDSDANVKVRDDLLDIKILVEVNADGLEQWRPIMKATFPLASDSIKELFGALSMDAPALERDAYTLDQFLAELAPDAGLRPAYVHKRRVRYVVGGCTSEVSEVTVEGHPTRTIAIESEDAAAVVAAVKGVGLADYLNTSYGKGLRLALDDVPARYAVIDAGTNSIKFHVAERATDGSFRRVVDRAEMTRLGEGLEESRLIGAEALKRAVDAIAGMATEARECGVLAISAVGTAVFRIASNAGEAIEQIRSRTGVTIEVLSGEEESRLAYVGATSAIEAATGATVVFDSGGGSSQFTYGLGDEVEERFSVNVGAVRFTEQFGLDGAVERDAVTQAMAAISQDLSDLDRRQQPAAVVGMGGAITNMTAVAKSLAKYDPDIVQGSVLDLTEIDRQIELYRTRSADERRTIVGLQPKRAEVILAGACIVRTIVDKLGVNEFTVSDRGLRHGVLIERFGVPAVTEKEGGVVTTATETNGRSAASAPKGGERRLTDEQMAEVMRLIRGSDSIELKVTVPADAHTATIRGLPLDPVEAQPRQVFFFDTPDLALNRAGIVVRARRVQGGKGDTVIKLRPVVPDELPKTVRRDPAFNVEVDILPGGFVCSASFKGRSTGQDIRDAISGKKPLSKLFSKAQREFYRQHAPEGVDLDSLITLGPTFILKARFLAHTGVVAKDPDRLMVGEMWLYPDGSRILELSTKCRPAEAMQVAAECRAYLTDRGVDLNAAQQTKTKTALEFYVREGTEEPAAATPTA